MGMPMGMIVNGAGQPLPPIGAQPAAGHGPPCHVLCPTCAFLASRAHPDHALPGDRPMTTPQPLTLDVRPHLARGEEPFAAIMAAAEALAPGQALRLLAPFLPVPLFSVMADRGFIAEERALSDGLWEVLFAPVPATTGAGLSPGSALGAAIWPDPVRSLDLAGAAPAEAGQRILAALELLEPGEVLFALLDREPAALFAQLTAGHHEWAGNHSSDGECYRLMIRCGTPT